MRTLLLMFAVVGLYCCAPQSSVEVAQTKPFFDLIGYIKTEEVRLKKAVTKAKKVTEVNAQREEREVIQPNFEEELAVFSQVDINRPAWYNQYKADTVRSETGAVLKLTYLAQNVTLKTRSMEVSLDTLGQVSNILIKAKSDNPVASTEQILTYSPSIGYTIDRTQDMALIPATRVKVKVTFK